MKTLKEYEAYKQAVERGLEGLTFVSTGACPGCKECGLGPEPSNEERELAEEAHFSYSACDCCGSTLGGDRHPAHGRDKDNQIVHFSVCVDCLYYINYGQLDDMTMAQLS